MEKNEKCFRTVEGIQWGSSNYIFHTTFRDSPDKEIGTRDTGPLWKGGETQESVGGSLVRVKQQETEVSRTTRKGISGFGVSRAQSRELQGYLRLATVPPAQSGPSATRSQLRSTSHRVLPFPAIPNTSNNPNSVVWQVLARKTINGEVIIINRGLGSSPHPSHHECVDLANFFMKLTSKLKQARVANSHSLMKELEAQMRELGKKNKELERKEKEIEEQRTQLLQMTGLLGSAVAN
ncbi:hypothetical protein BDQ17DRAFT_1331846 [Cyathus striatus]|nr:hypothetical protein BDQ17DRAFT_1331846 [Cyathus striatus]